MYQNCYYTDEKNEAGNYVPFDLKYANANYPSIWLLFMFCGRKNPKYIHLTAITRLGPKF